MTTANPDRVVEMRDWIIEATIFLDDLDSEDLTEEENTQRESLIYRALTRKLVADE